MHGWRGGEVEHGREQEENEGALGRAGMTAQEAWREPEVKGAVGGAAVGGIVGAATGHVGEGLLLGAGAGALGGTVYRLSKRNAPPPPPPAYDDRYRYNYPSYPAPPQPA
jgi:hypothetical protein